MARLAMSSLIALVLAAPAVATADDPGPVPAVPATDVGPGADEWLRVGLERYERGNLVGAIDAFERGYQREPRPTFLFALGQAHRKRGDCDRARASFDAFLATSPPKKQVDAAIQQREVCTPAEPTAAPTPAAPPPAPAPKILVVEHTTRTRAWYRDPIALGAGGATLALTGAGVALLLAADRAATGAADADTYDRHAQLRARAEARQLQASLAFGAAAVAAGVTVWRIARDRTERETREHERGATLTPVVGGGQVGVSLGGTF